MTKCPGMKNDDAEDTSLVCSDGAFHSLTSNIIYSLNRVVVCMSLTYSVGHPFVVVCYAAALNGDEIKPLHTYQNF